MGIRHTRTAMASPASRMLPPFSSSSSCFLLFLFFLLASSVTAATNSSAAAQESFLTCFSDRHPNASSDVLYIKNTDSYNTTYRSNIQNLRFLSPPNVKPVVIVIPANESQVQTSVVCANASGLGIRVRSGGHDFEGMSYVSDGEQFVVVDLINLRSVTVNIREGTARVGAGATLGEVYYNIDQVSVNLGFPAGICPTIGVGGHIAGGGIGTMLRKFGTAADNIVDAWLVDAQGNLLNRESMGEDLFWAIRGGGGASFGIVLSYDLKLVYVPSNVTVFTVGRTLNQGATRLVNRWQSIADKLDENLFVRVIAQATNDSEVPGGRNMQVLFNSLFLGTRDELLPLMQRSFPELGLQAQDCTEMTWIESVLYFAGLTGRAPEVLLDRTPEFNSSFKAKSDFVRAPIPQAGWESIWRFLMAARGEPLAMIMEPFGGRMANISETDIAFPHRAGNLFNIQYFMRWFETDAAVTQRHLDWMRELYTFMTPYVSSNPRAAYVNYKDIDLGRSKEGADGFAVANSTWGASYFRGNFQRLAYVKGRVDRSNFFRNEQSIPPLV